MTPYVSQCEDILRELLVTGHNTRHQYSGPQLRPDPLKISDLLPAHSKPISHYNENIKTHLVGDIQIIKQSKAKNRFTKIM